MSAYGTESPTCLWALSIILTCFNWWTHAHLFESVDTWPTSCINQGKSFGRWEFISKQEYQKAPNWRQVKTAFCPQFIQLLINTNLEQLTISPITLDDLREIQEQDLTSSDFAWATAKLLWEFCLYLDMGHITVESPLQRIQEKW